LRLVSITVIIASALNLSVQQQRFGSLSTSVVFTDLAETLKMRTETITHAT